MTVELGKRYLVFDHHEWDQFGDVMGRGDNSKYWHPAVIDELYVNTDLAELANVRFDHKPEEVSTGHFCTLIHELPESLRARTREESNQRMIAQESANL